MAKVEAVWGIDLGNSSLKALRCRFGDQPDQIVADAFDYIEYPKILTQPGAEPEQLVGDALAQFQARNSVRGDRVAVCVSGQSGLARFIKLPPVEAKRIPDIVKYEARQQIPFDLDDVIWDYQQIAGGMEVEGFVLEAEVGIFAMKRDQVFRALEPLQSVGIDVDCVQLAPLSLYNFLVFDQLYDLPPADEYDPEDPPTSWIVLSMGTDATDLVVTNGYRVWQRSIPIGGNHFTKALTKELKLTFAKAEHLKRNASSAQDPKAVFQAMRPVFSDLLTEIQRSVNYFTSIDRAAKIGKILPLGNAMKLPGLPRYLGQNLGYEVVRLDRFRGLVGAEVVNAPAFKENLLAFGPCYGLALQGLGKSSLTTDLLPREIVKDRLIRQKKPWAVAAAAVLLLGCTISFASYSRAMGTMGTKERGPFSSAESEAETVVSESESLKSSASTEESQFQETNQIGKHLVGNVEGRLRWLELLRAINSCLPRDPEGQRPEDISLRNEIHIENLQCYHLEKLEDWFAARQKWYRPPEEAADASSTPAATPPGGAEAEVSNPGEADPNAGMAGAAASPAGADATGMGTAAPAADAAGGNGPAGPGWVVRLEGFHYHNRSTAVDPTGVRFIQGAEYVRETLIKNLEGLGEKLVLPRGIEQGEELVSVKELGIGYPVLIDPGQIVDEIVINPNVEGASRFPMGRTGMPYGEDYGGEERAYMPGGFGPGGSRRPGAATAEEGEEEDPAIEVRRFDLEVEFVWQPKLPSERHEEQQPTEPGTEVQP